LSAAESSYSALHLITGLGRQDETTARQIDQQFQDVVDPAVNMLLC
jgi:hypothetical protein